MTDANTGRFALFRQLMADGITSMFGNPGSSEESLLDALSAPEFASFRYYLALQEGSVVAMADAYARAMPPELRDGDVAAWKRPVLVQLHSYAGLANGLGMIYAAKRGYTPMVVLAGEAGLGYEALDGQMAADLPAIVRPFVKSDHNGPCAWRVNDAGSLLRLVRRAVKTAATPPFGPVFLALPMDVLDRPSNEPIARSFPVASRVGPDPEAIGLAARLLTDASYPVILMGDGITAADAQGELVRLAEHLGAPVWGANDSEINMPADHPLSAGSLGHMFGDESRHILAAADVVLICGTTVLPEVFPAIEGPFAPATKVIHFDLNVAEIGKTYAFTVGALGDPKLSLNALAAAVDRIMDAGARDRARARSNAHSRNKQELHEKMLAADTAAWAAGGLQVSHFAANLAARLPDDALIFDEAITSSPEVMRYVSREMPGRYFQTRAGMLGTGLPGTVGLKIAHPDKLVVGFCGDGGGISTIQALATAARYGIGAKFVVCNNRSYRILKYNLQDYRRRQRLPEEDPFPNSFDLLRPELRFDLLARAQGVNALRIEQPDQVTAALDAALKDPDEPFLIELLLTQLT